MENNENKDKKYENSLIHGTYHGVLRLSCEDDTPYNIAREQNIACEQNTIHAQNEESLMAFSMQPMKDIFAQNDEELQYLNLVKNIISNGVLCENRTGTKTYTIMGTMLRFDLSKGFPLLTTKKMNWNAVCEELFWFIAGETNSRLLSDKGVHIWDGNSSREYLDSKGLTKYSVGELGPIYGFQWRHFGAEYEDCNTNYDGFGVDQLSNCINQLKKDPNSRQIVLTAWNPLDIGKMALPPCHMISHFRIINGKLNCTMFQRSADVGLGVPFNIASYALLTHLIAVTCDIDVGQLIIMMSDTHIYENHLDAMKKQITRKPYNFPKLVVNCKNIFKCRFEDLVLQDYNHYSHLMMKMAV